MLKQVYACYMIVIMTITQNMLLYTNVNAKRKLFSYLLRAEYKCIFNR